MGTPYKDFTYISGGDMTSNVTGTAIDASNIDALDFQCVWTGTPTGTLSVQQSNDNTTWTELTGMTQATGGAAGNHIFQIWKATGMYYRVVYTSSSSTGTLNVKAVKKDL